MLWVTRIQVNVSVSQSYGLIIKDMKGKIHQVSRLEKVAVIESYIVLFLYFLHRA